MAALLRWPPTVTLDQPTGPTLTALGHLIPREA